jgi:hypothetical protein
VFEVWQSVTALEEHFRTPHAAEFQKAAAAFGVKEMQIRRYYVERVGPLGGGGRGVSTRAARFSVGAAKLDTAIRFDHGDGWPYRHCMATTTIKTTYALDVETVGALESLARRWNVTKSEALRRAIRASASAYAVKEPPEPLRALHELQQALALAPATAARSRAERRAGSRRREERTR